MGMAGRDVRCCFFLILLVAGISGCMTPDQGAPTPLSQVPQAIPVIHFRSFTESDSRLQPRFTHKKGDYSLRAPVCWDRVTTQDRLKDDASTKYKTIFEDPQTKDYLEIGISKQSLSKLDQVHLNKFMDTRTAELLTAKRTTLVGAQVFRLGKYLVDQVITQTPRQFILHLYVFPKPERCVQITIGVGFFRYVFMGRRIEACLATLDCGPNKAQP